MPLLSKRIFNCVKPLTSVGASEKVLDLNHFNREYEKRLQLYKKRIWTCQSTGHVNLTHEEAWNSEKTVLKTLKEQFAPCYDKPVLELVHHSTKSLDCLVDQAWLMLQQTLVVGERVLLKVKSGSKSMKAIVVKVDTAGVEANPTSNCSSPSSDKENAEKDDNTGKKWVPPKLLPYKYSIRFENEDSVIHSVPAGDLSRGDKPPSKELLRLFIRTYAVRAGQTPNSPWIVDDVQVKKLDLPLKFANFLLSPVKWRSDEVAKKIDEEVKNYRSPSKGSPRIKTKMDAKEEKRKEKAKKSIIKLKEKGERAKAKESAKKSEVVVLSDSDDDGGGGGGRKNKEEADSDSDTPLSVVKTQLSPKKKSSSSAEKSKHKVKSKYPLSLADLKKKLEKKKLKKELKSKDKGSKKEKKRSKKGQDPKQLTLLDLAKKDKDKGMKTPEKKTALKQKTPQKTPDSSRKKVFSPSRMPPIIIKLQKAIKKGDKNLIRFCTTHAAKVLNSAQRDRLPDDVRGLVVQKYEALQEKQKLSRMTEEEKKEYLAKQADAKKAKVRERKLQLKREARQKMKALNKRHEDTKLDLKELPAPKLVPTPDNIPNEAFGDIIMITELIANYCGLLMPDDEYPIYTGALMKALATGKDGFTYLCRVVIVLLQTLLQDQIAEDYQDLEIALSEIPISPCTCSELIRLCLRRRDTTDDKSDTSEEEEELQEDEVPEDLIQLMENQELYQLDPVQKIQILKGLCLRVMGTYSVQDYMEEKQQQASALWRKKLAMFKDKKKKTEKLPKDGKEDEKKPMKEEKEDSKDTKTEESPNMLLTHFYGKKGDDIKSEPGDKSDDKKTVGDKDSMKNGDETPMDVDDMDMISAVKRRRVTTAQAAEERRQRDIEERIKKERYEKIYREQKEQETFQKEFTDGINLAKLSLRQVPIGTDRFHSRYWVFSDVTPGLYVEKGWVGEEINYSCCPDRDVEEDLSDSASDDDEAQDEENAAPGKKNKPAVMKKCIDTTFPHEGQNLWFVYESIKDVDQLIESLHNQGARESRLKKELQKRYTEIKNAIIKYQRSNKELRDCDGDKEVIQAFKREVLETETRLRNGGLGGVDEFPSWSIRLETSEEMGPLAECLLETQENVLEKFRDGIMVVKKKKKKEEEEAEEDDEPVMPEMATGIIYWRDAVKNSATYSRLHVLLGMLDSCIKWEKSAENAKCKICRKKFQEDKLLLCDVCNQAFHMFCLRPALMDVPMGDWHCPACAPTRKRVREIRGRYTEEANSDSEEVDDEEEVKVKKRKGVISHDETCFECKGDESLILCAECPSAYHLECHDPPLRHPPRGRWVCNDCKNGINRRNKQKQGRRARVANKRKRYAEQESEEEEERESTPLTKRQCTSKRKSATKQADSDKNGDDEWSPDSKPNSESRTKSSRGVGRPRGRKSEEAVEEEEEETDDEATDVDSEAEKKVKKAAQPRKSKSPKSAGRPKKRRLEPVDEVVYDSKPKASRRAPSELSVIENIIDKMLTFKDAWPFYLNVCKKDVPDYYEIIKHPISFQKIKDRLNCLVYGSPQEVIDAVALLVRNGIEYNKVDSEVYKCLEATEKHFVELLSKRLPQYVYSRDVVANGYGDHMYTDDGRRSRRSK